MEYSEYSNEYIDDLLLEDVEEEMDEEDERLLLADLRRDFMLNLQMWE